jgi:hypothetical protein
MITGQQIEFIVPKNLNLTSYFLEENILRGRGDKVSVYYQNRTYTYNDLCSLTNKI